jgi:hypothetical protein
MALTYKMTEDSSAVQCNDKGFPIVVDSDSGEEIGLDAIHLYTKVPTLTNETKQLKDKLKKTEDSLSHFEGIEDLGKWKSDAEKAIATLKNIDDKKLIDAGEVDTIKRQAQEHLQEKLDILKGQYEEKIASLDKSLQDKTGTIYQLMVADRFNSSTFVQDKLAMTSKMARKYFGDNFRVEEEGGSVGVVGYWNGEKIYSKERVGEPADFEEALEIMVSKDPDRDSLLAGKAAKGSGAGASDGDSTTAGLEQKYKDAIQKGDVVGAIALKNKIFATKKT